MLPRIGSRSDRPRLGSPPEYTSSYNIGSDNILTNKGPILSADLLDSLMESEITLGVEVSFLKESGR